MSVVHKRLLLIVLCMGAWCGTVHAHEVRPGYLELREASAGYWDVLWKVPARGNQRLGLYVQFPDECSAGKHGGRYVNGAYVERWRAHCPGSLIGRTVTIRGLSASGTDVLVRANLAGGSSQTERLTPSSPTFIVAAAQGRAAVVRTYLGLGVEHILLGIDHLLFVLGLLFLVGNGRRLLVTVSAFTLAHSLTLAAATLGWIRVSQAPVEAAIALSIVFVAVEILHARQGRETLAVRMPCAIAFLFGLLHGLGFASALQQLGLPPNAVPLALALFNVGVELGQLLFIGTVFASLSLSRAIARKAGHGESPFRIASGHAVAAAYTIGTLGMFWVFDRTSTFWS